MSSDVELQALERPVSRREIRRGRVLLVGALALGATSLAAVFGLSEPKPIYSRTVSELMQRQLRETRVRVQGVLVHGSLCKVETKCEFRFRLTDIPWRSPSGAPRELEVRYRGCIIPDTFGDVPGLDVEITAEGALCDGCSHFEATEIMAKCPSKYELRDGGGYARPPRPVPSCRLTPAR